MSKISLEGLAHHLRVAAQTYTTDAEVMRQSLQDGIALQLVRQAKECNELASAACNGLISINQDNIIFTGE